MTGRDQYEVVVIGAGVAGASFAHFLSQRGVSDVLLVERERAAGYHATGRSAALALEFDAHPTVQRLKAMGTRFLREPGAGFSHNPLLQTQGAMLLFREPTLSAVHGLAVQRRGAGTVAIDLLSPAQARERVGVLEAREFDGAVLFPDSARIDVHELVSSYLRGAKSRGVEIRYDLEVTGIRVERGACSAIATPRGEIRARRIVNAAGAWAGPIGALAGAAPLELTPRRRCAVVYDAPQRLDVRGWPHVGSPHHGVYFEPESGGLLMSPMDEDAMLPCDAHPDELVVAAGLERLRALAPAIAPRSLRRRWAGLRTFAPDGVPVVGEDPLLRGFFWLAGQGGTGIATSGAIAAIAVDLFTEGRTERLDASALSPARFRGA